MFFEHLFKIFKSIFAFMIICPLLVYGKGLDTLSPKVQGQPQGDIKKEGEPSPQKETSPTSDKKQPEVKKPEQEQQQQEDQQEEQQQEASSQEKKQKTVEPSEISKKLSNKLYLSSSIGFVSISKTSGDFDSRACSDLSVGYFVKDLTNYNVKLHSTFRYLPVDTTATKNHQSYRGIMEDYAFGVMGTRPFKDKENVLLIATGEIGYAKFHLYPTDDFEKDSSIENGGLNLIVGGGSDFLFKEKIKIGPRLFLGFGSVRIIHLSGMFTYVF
ncbi:MAG: hypothetical protein HQK54_00385 [Oligoflexales bacterium]|nr:hypothetical protein [Oligoflexales bacterium]